MIFTFKNIVIDMYESIRIGHGDGIDSLLKRFTEKTISETQMSIELICLLTRHITIDGDNIDQSSFEKIISFEMDIDDTSKLVEFATSCLEELKKKKISDTSMKSSSIKGVVTSRKSGKK